MSIFDEDNMFQGMEWLGGNIESTPLEYQTTVSRFDVGTRPGVCVLEVTTYIKSGRKEAGVVGIAEFIDENKLRQITEDCSSCHRSLKSIEELAKVVGSDFSKDVSIELAFRPGPTVPAMRLLNENPVTDQVPERLSFEYAIRRLIPSMPDKLLAEVPAILRSDKRIVEAWSAAVISCLSAFAWLNLVVDPAKLEWIHFYTARNGGVFARSRESGRISFPARCEAEPRPGSFWLVEVVGQNPRGTVNFVRLITDRYPIW